MLFRVFWTPHANGAKTKARLLWHHRQGIARPGPDPVFCRPAGGVESIEFTAASYRDGRDAMQELILNGDPRPIMGRSNLRIFRVDDADEGDPSDPSPEEQEAAGLEADEPHS